MAGPDLDELFGEAPAHGAVEAGGEKVCSVHVGCGPHHALLHAVGLILDTDLGDHIVEQHEDLLQEVEEDSDSDDPYEEEEGMAAPADKALLQLLMSAKTAFESRDWATCAVSSAAARTSAIQLLRENWRAGDDAHCQELLRKDIWQCPVHRHCDLPESDYTPLVLAELLLALCAAAEADYLAAVQHADVAFAFAAPGEARNAALLFSKCLADTVATCREACAGEAVSASFVTHKPRCVSRPILTMSVTAVERWLSPNPPRMFSGYSDAATVVPDLQELQTLIASGMPFIIKEPVENWPASVHWASLSYLNGLAGHHMVPVKRLPHDDAMFMTFSEFLIKYLVPSCNYCNVHGESAESAHDVACLAPLELLDLCPALRSDVLPLAASWRQALGRIRRTSVWLGAHNVATANCASAREQCIVQVFGVRYAILYPPKAGKSFSKRDQAQRDSRYYGGISEVDIEDKGLLKQHPELKQVTAQVAELSPGDLLFIPRGWWHQLRSLSPACSISFRF